MKSLDVGLENILLLGDPRLRENCSPVVPKELDVLDHFVDQMASLIVTFRKTYGKGRAIAAPQIGLLKNLIVINIDNPVALYNPTLSFPHNKQIELWDDCMSFPNLMVRVKRYDKCTVNFKDRDWKDQHWELEGDMSELLQHEYDHLRGVLAIDRAIDKDAFKWFVPATP